MAVVAVMAVLEVTRRWAFGNAVGRAGGTGAWRPRILSASRRRAAAAANIAAATTLRRTASPVPGLAGPGPGIAVPAVTATVVRLVVAATERAKGDEGKQRCRRQFLLHHPHLLRPLCPLRRPPLRRRWERRKHSATRRRRRRRRRREVAGGALGSWGA